MTILNIPYVSQLEAGARKYNNDCGAASGVMLVKAYKGDQSLTVDEYYQKTGQRKDEYLSAGRVMSVLGSYNIPSTWRINITRKDVGLFLREKRPIIVLFNYAIIRSRGIKTQIPFNGFHFAVLVGMDDYTVYINDPLWTGNKGKELRIPIDTWMEAWETFPLSDNGVPANPPRGAIVPKYPFDTAEVKPIEYDPDDVSRMRIIYPHGMNVRSGPGVDHSIVDTYNQGDIVTILKTQKWGENLWGCLDRERWIAIQYNGNTYLVPDFPGGVDDPKDHSVMEVISQEGLNVRSGKGISFPIVNVLMYGDRIKVYKRVKSDNNEWGRIGVNQWIAIKYKGETLAR
jgi:uncharacterized protein YraI